jgi:hypothetical protein
LTGGLPTSPPRCTPTYRSNTPSRYQRRSAARRRRDARPGRLGLPPRHHLRRPRHRSTRSVRGRADAANARHDVVTSPFGGADAAAMRREDRHRRRGAQQRRPAPSGRESHTTARKAWPALPGKSPPIGADSCRSPEPKEQRHPAVEAPEGLLRDRLCHRIGRLLPQRAGQETGGHPYR